MLFRSAKSKVEEAADSFAEIGEEPSTENTPLDLSPWCRMISSPDNGTLTDTGLAALNMQQLWWQM